MKGVIEQDNLANSRRLKILGKDEIRNIFELPQFTHDERLLYFSLTEAEKEFLEQSRSLTAQVYFILQLGYFKARHIFFNFELESVREDVEFVLQSYFPGQKINFGQTVAKNTRLKQQQFTANLYRFQWCGKDQRRLIVDKARKFAKISVKPIYIFREIVSFLQAENIILPGYSLLQDIVGRAINFEQTRLTNLLEKSLKSSDIKLLDGLLIDSANFYEVTQLKREPKDLSLTEIKREIERAAQLREIYQLSKKLLPELDLPNQSIAYYSSLVFYYSVYKLKRFYPRVVYLYLLCFAHQRYQRVNDNLINSLIYRLRQYTDQAKAETEEKLFSIRLETNQNIGKATQILKLFTDQQIPPETPFGEVQQKAFKILSPEAINRVAEHITREKKFDETELRWEYLEKISHRIKLNLRPILTAVEFTASSTDAHLLEAIAFLRQIILADKPFQQIPSDKFPVSFIPENQKRYLYTFDKKTKQKKIIPDRYEFLVYRILRDGLEAGEIYCRDSIRFRSFEDDLLDDEHWQNKELLIENANLPILKDSITTHLEFLKEILENQIEQVNGRIISAENKHLVFKSGNSQNRWVLEYPAKVDGVNDSFFDSIPQVNLNNVLRF